MTDMEGISGIRRGEEVSKGSPTYAHGQKLMMGDINAAIAGAFDGGAAEVLVCDSHGGGHNFIIAEMDPRADYIENGGALNLMAGLDSDFDAFFAVGYHAKAGTPSAFLDHTQSSASVFDYTVNGKSVGELGQQVYLAGGQDVPQVYVTGDRAACEEALELTPGIVTAAVKDAFGRERVKCIAPERARRMIREGAADAVRKLKDHRPEPVVIAPPIEVTLTLYRTDMVDRFLMGRTGFERVDGRTMKMVVDDVREILKIF